MLGPQVKPVGSGDALLSEQVKAATEHKYAPERYMYREVRGGYVGARGKCGGVVGRKGPLWIRGRG